MDTVIIVFISLFVMACGEHSRTRESFIRTGQEQSTGEVTDPMGQLSMALMDNREERFFEIMKTHSIDINAAFSNGHTLIAEALFQRKTPIIRGLKSRGANWESVRVEGKAFPVWMEEQSDQPRIRRALEKTQADDETDLSEVLMTNDFRLMKEVINEGVNVNFLMKDGETPLTGAIESRKLNSLRALLSSFSLDVNLPNRWGERPLTLVRKYQLRAIENELLRRGAFEKVGE